MAQESDENGLKNLNVLRYWKYVLKNKTSTLSIVFARQVNPQVLMQTTFYNVFFQDGVFPNEDLAFYRGTVVSREQLENENGGEFWGKIDYLYCEKDDPLQNLAMACGVTCITDEIEILSKIVNKVKPDSLSRVENFEKAKNLLT